MKKVLYLIVIVNSWSMILLIPIQFRLIDMIETLVLIKLVRQIGRKVETIIDTSCCNPLK